MALLGTAALAMWWDMAAPARAEFEHWHAHEHFPERLAIPGFLRASRWRSSDGGDGVFVLYELQDHAVLSSAAYAARLNAPSAWSTQMMPHHRGMVRSQCQVLASRGAATARHALAARLSPAPGRAPDLLAAWTALAQELVVAPGITGLHLLRHETPALAQTAEQALRGLSDRTADWVLLVCGYDGDAVAGLQQHALAAARLADMGVAEGAWMGLYELAYCAVPGDVADVRL